MRVDGAPNAPSLKIAMVVASPFPANHGTPGSIREMAAAIAARGHEVHVVTYHFGEGAPPAGVSVHRIPDLGLRRKVVVGPTWAKPLQDLQMVFTLWRVIRRQGIDLIHAHNYEGAMVGYMGRLVTGRPLLYNACNTMSDELGSYGFLPRVLADRLARFLDYWVPRLPDTTVAISEDLAHFLRGQGVPADRIDVIPLGVDAAMFGGVDRAEARARLNLGDEPLVVYTGCLDGLQRIDYLLKAMTVVVQSVPRARLLIVANAVKDEQLALCRTQAAEQSLGDRVDIVVSESFEQVPYYLAAADVAVVPRPSCPGFPVKLLNYLAAGTPTALFEGSAKGLEHGVNALLAPDHDWRSLGAHIATILGDRDLGTRLAANGRRWIEEQYSWPALTERILRVYARLLDPGPGGAATADVRSQPRN
jgi:1,2-diacylglycerol 3-alpha-glucosyltransferase